MNYRKFHIAIFIGLLFFLFNTSLFSQINKHGIPFFHNYSAKVYEANEQNWSIVQDHRGLIYVGNQENGVLEYDGNQWRKIALPNNPSVRSLAVDSMGTVFVGAVGEIGFIEPDANGFLVYQSLSHLVDSAHSGFGHVWRTFASRNKVYFTTVTKIFVYDYQTIQVIDLPENSFFSFLIDDHIYTGNPRIGMQLLDNEKMEMKDAIGGEFYEKKNIIFMGPYDDSRYLVSTYQRGSFLYDKKLGISTYLPVPSKNYNVLLNNGAYDGTVLNRNKYALATLYKGVIVFDKDGNVNYQIAKQNGLQDDMISFVYQNKLQKNEPLWVAMNNGISKIEVSSPFNYFDEISGINDIAAFNDVIYVSTDEGLYSLDYEDKMPVFKKQEGLTSQAWHFYHMKNGNQEKLFLATKLGIYLIEANEVIKLGNSYDCRILYQSDQNQENVFVGTTEGLLHVQYNAINNQWKETGFIEGIDYEIHSIAEDENGVLWLGTYLNGVVAFDQKNQAHKIYGTDDGLPVLKSIQVVNLKNDLLFTTEKGIYTFNANTKKFEAYTAFGESFIDGSKGVLNLFPDEKERLWSISFKDNTYWIEVLTKAYSDHYILLDKPFKRLPKMTFQSVFTDKNDITWIGGPEGLFSFDNNLKRSYDNQFNTLIRKVSIGQDSTIFGGAFFSIAEDSSKTIVLQQNDVLTPEIDYEYNTITIEFAALFFENEDAIEYSWMLEGLEKHWNHWSDENKVSYNNLLEGTYTFKVRARNVYDTKSTITEYKFKISPPVYRTIVAYIVYFIVFILLIRLIIKLNVRRLEKEKIRLEGIVKERTAEVVQQKEKIEKAYENVKMLSKIGQDVTANLSVDAILEVVYENVNTLMDAKIFAIGIYNEEKKALDFLGKESKHGKILRNSDPLDNEKLLSVWCFNNQQEIFINYYSQNNHPFEQYASDPNFKVRESLIYLPLAAKEKKIGIISVQSIRPNAYSDYHLNILKNLAVYTSIALDNAEAYEKIEAQKTEIEKKNATLQQQKEEIIAQRDEIEAQRDYVTQQRDQIARQKQAITDSIQYAKRIQSAVLPPAEQIAQSLSDHFILFKPRDIVSGDFYWMRQIDHYVVITAADCTGHGVPGAFMSMLGVSFLNEIVRRKDITKASQVLNELRRYVKTSLRQTGKEGEAKDGMDMSLCVIDLENYKLQYAGAYNPLYVFRKGDLIERKADKMPIGIHINEKETFTNHELDIKKEDVIYMFSDGFPDQFGGENGGKFKTKKFKILLGEIYEKPMEEQKEILDQTLINWQGNHEQVDDITIIGIRIN